MSYLISSLYIYGSVEDPGPQILSSSNRGWDPTLMHTIGPRMNLSEQTMVNCLGSHTYYILLAAENNLRLCAASPKPVGQQNESAVST